MEELELQGTIRTKAGWLAMMRGGDNRSYLLRKGTTVFDGEVWSIGHQRSSSVRTSTTRRAPSPSGTS